ncbi:MAG TPA: hypothetical protein VLM42_06320 [Bryobacteraceae bacterium]|nr:hypothetical protein [Bryobacteraceae bacterium]
MFVDGSHPFEDVLRDTANTIFMLSAAGVALWHDVAPDSPGVVKALDACGRGHVLFSEDTSKVSIRQSAEEFDARIRVVKPREVPISKQRLGFNTRASVASTSCSYELGVS